MSSSGTNSGAEEDLAEKIRGKRRARSPLQYRQTQTAGQQQHGDQQKQPLASSLKSSQSGQQQSQKGERMVGARFKIKRSSIDLGRRQVGGPRQQIQPTIDEGKSLENSQGSDGGPNGGDSPEQIQMKEMKVHPLLGGSRQMDRRFSKGGSSLEFPPNIEFYRNTLENEGTPTRPSMMDLVEGMKQKQQSRRESVFSVEKFRERNVEIMEGQRRVLGKVRNQPKRSESDSSKKSLYVQKQSATSPTLAVGGDGSKSVTATKFGWIEGVLIRCMASIFGVMLYLRLSWVAGQSGLLLASCVILLGSCITIITTLSTSAICTNGLVKGGGAYFLISRSLGPEFGGSIGIIFSIANAVGAGMYLVGFSETIRDLLKGHSIYLLDGDINDIRLIALIACAFIVVVILVGLSFESKMQIVLMVVLWVSIFDYWIGTFLPPSDEQQRKGITGYRIETIKENLMPQFRDGYDFFTVFAVYFPAATGIMAGANISGDLKDPQTAIPLGTLMAIAITTFVYLLMVWMTGSTTLRDADGLNLPQLLAQAANASKEVLLEQFASQSILVVASNATEHFNESLATPSPIVHDMEKLSSSQLYYSPPTCLLNQTCQYGLMNYFQIVELGSAFGPIVTIGIIASTLSSALVSMVGAPKIFQAVCRDRLFPYINRFGRGHGPNDEPRQALFLASVIVVAVILIGNLNMIAPLISNFFLCSYALINYACFDNSFAHSPGFRPSFKFYNMWVSLAGSLMCVFCMFIISWWTALLTFFFFVTIYMYVAHRKPDVNWGSSAQAHSYRNALQYVSKLERTEEHVKNYRPQILVLSGNPAARSGLVDFAYSITKGASLLICGYIVPYKACNSVFMMMQKFNQQLRDWFVSRHLKATFAVTVANPNIRAGTQSLLQIAGLGKLRPNIILMGYKQNWAQRQSDEAMAEMNDYFGLIQDAFDLNMSVGVLRNSNKGLDISDLILESTEELKQHLGQMETSSTRSYPTESHPSQQQSIIQHSPRTPSPTLTAAGPAAVNPRQKARDMLLKAFGQQGQTMRGLTVQSSTTGGGGGETLQTTLGGGGGSITQSSSSTMLKQRKGLKGWLSGGGDREDMERANEEDPQQPAASLSLPLPSDAIRFQTRVKHGTIDVWWLYDDGGLTLLIPYLLTKEKSYLEGAKLRVFTLAGQGKNLQQEQQGLVSMLKKFRITADQVNVIPDFTNKRPDSKSLDKFNQLIEPFVYRFERKNSNITIPLDGNEEDGINANEDAEPGEGLVTEAELNAQQDRTWRQLRIAELLRRYSSGSDLIVVTLPVPRRGLISGPLFLAWLEIMTNDLPPTLLLRGNQQSVLTFYS